jgi:hypothetical protein
MRKKRMKQLHAEVLQQMRDQRRNLEERIADTADLLQEMHDRHQPKLRRGHSDAIEFACTECHMKWPCKNMNELRKVRHVLNGYGDFPTATYSPIIWLSDRDRQPIGKVTVTAERKSDDEDREDSE